MFPLFDETGEVLLPVHISKRRGAAEIRQDAVSSSASLLPQIRGFKMLIPLTSKPCGASWESGARLSWASRHTIIKQTDRTSSKPLQQPASQQPHSAQEHMSKTTTRCRQAGCISRRLLGREKTLQPENGSPCPDPAAADFLSLWWKLDTMLRQAVVSSWC